ncbi:DUF4369 domain-containing protein [Marinifilum sp. RC60d5]|uniref:DUF4369 domain-containing protein n=1 Tax=Marinifilum sp. RC60d5 TaxID=3458414 RepID=UPI004036AC50
MKKILFLLFISFHTIFLSLAQEKEFVLQGMIGGLQEKTIYLYKDSGENLELIDSIQTNNGEFKFTGKCSQAFAAELRISRGRRGKIFISPSRMNLFVHKDKMKHGFLIGKLKGSPAQDRYEDFQLQLGKNNKEKLKIADNLEIPEVQSDSVQKAHFMAEYGRLNHFKDDYYYKYASSPVIPYLIYQEYFAAKKNLQYIKKQLKTLTLANPNGMYVKNLKKRVAIIDRLKNHGQFPDIKEKTLTGKQFDLNQLKGEYVLLYIWRAWFPEQNEKYYQSIQELTTKYPQLNVVSIIRNSSYNMIRIPGTNKGEHWSPEARTELNCIEIESLDKSVEFVKYLDRNLQIFLLDKHGKILFNQTKLNSEKLHSQLSKYL